MTWSFVPRFRWAIWLGEVSTALLILVSISIQPGVPENNATTLLSPPHSIAGVLASDHLLGPNTDIRLKHGVIGLLKNLAQACAHSAEISSFFTKANIAQKLIHSRVWAVDNDPMAEIVQIRAIGVAKHLCNASGTIQCGMPFTVRTNG
jgi:hypothetical protein